MWLNKIVSDIEDTLFLRASFSVARVYGYLLSSVPSIALLGTNTMYALSDRSITYTYICTRLSRYWHLGCWRCKRWYRGSFKKLYKCFTKGDRAWALIIGAVAPNIGTATKIHLYVKFHDNIVFWIVGGNLNRSPITTITMSRFND